MRIALAFIALVGSGLPLTHAADGYQLLSFEGFGNIGIQDLPGAGNSYAGGFHYTPTMKVADSISLKLLAGLQTFKETSVTGKNVYFVLDYKIAAQLEFFTPILINVGGGGGTDLRSQGKTRGQVMLGFEYLFENEKLIGFFDRAVLNGNYVFNSGDLWVIQYGLGINL